jgi:hypothetical protein
LPYAKLLYTKDWTVTLSHEVLETVVNAYLSRYKGVVLSNQNVSFLIEVVDPVQIQTYSIDGVTVNNFVTPNYYDLLATSGVKYDYLGKLSKPYELDETGYYSYVDKLNKWYQVRYFKGKRTVVNLSDTATELVKESPVQVTILSILAVLLLYLYFNKSKKKNE